jgi:hypothetical protein
MALGAERAKATAGAGKHAKKPKWPGWTKERREIFFAELAEICNVAAAVRAAGFPHAQAAYNQKKRDPEFRAEWDEAIAEGYSRLELEMLERARFGENRAADVGESGPRQRAIPTALALSLLKLHESRMRGRGSAVQRPMRGQKLLNEVEARLGEINRRLGGNG